MKRKIVALLCVVAMMVCTLASCKIEKECEHTFSDAWASDATNHWHAATCEHGEIKDSLAAHADADQDGKCDVCTYEIGHTHTFAETWTSDDTKHWKAATCSHTDVKGEEALHTDDNTDGKCDVCEGHVHIVDATGFCTGCGKQVEEVDESELGKLIAAIVAGANKVTGATVNYLAQMRGSTTQESKHDVTYQLGTNGAYYKRVDGDGTSERWLTPISTEEVTAVIVTSDADGIVSAEPSAASVDELLGYYYSVSTLADGYGAEAVLKALYDISKLETVSELKTETDDANNTVKLSYNVLIINTMVGEGEVEHVDYYEVQITFGYTDDFVLTSMEIVCDCYGNSLENEADNDYTYDPATKTITMKETAKADTYTIKTTQTAGNRAEIEMKSMDSFVPTEIKLYKDATMNTVADTVTFKFDDDEWPVIYVGCTPADSFIKFAKEYLTIELRDKNGQKVPAGAMLVGEVIQILPAAPGEYTLYVKYKEAEHNVRVVVESNAIPGANHFEVTTTDTYSLVDQYTFTATVSGTYTFYVATGTLTIVDAAKYDANPWTNPYVDYNMAGNNPVSSFTVEIAAGQTFSFYYGAMAKATYTIGWDVSEHEVEVGGGDQGGSTVSETPLGVNGSSNEIKGTDVTFAYTASAAGSLKLSLGNAIMGPVTVTYSVNGGAAVDFVLGTEVVLELVAGDKVVITVVTSSGWSSLGATWTAGGGEVTVPSLNLGSNSITITEAEAAEGGKEFSFTSGEAGTYTFDSNDVGVRLFDSTGAMVGTGWVELTANTTYKAFVLSESAGTYTVEVTYTAPAGGEGGSGGDSNEPAGYLSNGENTITVTDANIEAGTMIYEFFTMENGDYKFSSNALMATVKDENGNVIGTGKVTLTAWTSYVVEINTSYVSGAGDYVLNVEYLAPLGHQDNPIEIVFGNHTATYAGNSASPIWHKVVASANGKITVTSTNATATLSITRVMGNEVQGNGTVTLDVIAGQTYYIGIADFEATAEVSIPFTVAFAAGEIERDGSMNVPYELVMGENTCVIPQWENRIYLYIATQAGTLTVTKTNANGSWFLAKTNPVGIESTENTISIEVEAGDVIYLTVATADWNADTVVFNASFASAPTGIAIQSGIASGVANTLAIEENTYLYGDFYGMGDYIVTWDNANVVIKVNGVAIASGDKISAMNSRMPVSFEIYGVNYAAVASVKVLVETYVAPAPALDMGDNTVTIATYWGETAVEFTAPAAGTYVILPGVNAVVVYDSVAYFNAGEDTLELTLAEGEKVSLIIMTENYEAGDVVVTVNEKAPSGSGDSGSGEGGATGATLTFVTPAQFSSSDRQSFTAAEAGTYVISVSGLKANTWVQYSSDSGNSWNRVENNLPYSIELSAGQEIIMKLFGAMGIASADVGAEVTVTIAKA